MSDRSHRDAKRSKYRRQAAAQRGGSQQSATVFLDRHRPGIFVTCPRNKEARATRDALDLFDTLLSRCYPDRARVGATAGDEDDEDDGDIDKAMAKELTSLAETNSRKASKTDTFMPVTLETECLLFITTPEGVDPVRICEAAVQDLVETGMPRSVNISRLTPISAMCSSSDASDFDDLATRTLSPLFSAPPTGLRWRIDYGSRSYNGPLNRDLLLPRLGALVSALLPAPDAAAVDLARPTHVVVVEVFKHVCGIALVPAEWYDGPPLVPRDGGKARGGQYRRFGLGALADDLVKARASAAGPANEMDLTA